MFVSNIEMIYNPWSGDKPWLSRITIQAHNFADSGTVITITSMYLRETPEHAYSEAMAQALAIGALDELLGGHPVPLTINKMVPQKLLTSLSKKTGKPLEINSE